MNFIDNYLVKQISELKEIIKMKDVKINELEEQLNEYKKQKVKIDTEKNIKKEDLYNDFNIKLRDPIHKLNNHTTSIYYLAKIKDGRLVSGSLVSSIIIYNKETSKPDLKIVEHNVSVNCITTLSSGILTSCSSDKIIKLFNIKENIYNVI